MEEATIIAAAISGGLGFLAAILLGYKDELVALLSPSKRNISGWWEGSASDIEIPEYFGENRENFEYQLKVNIKQRGKRVAGEALVTADINFRIAFKGKFIDDDYFYIEWRYPDKNVKGFGYSLYKVLGIGNQIEGTSFFSRLRSEGIAVANVKLQQA